MEASRNIKCRADLIFRRCIVLTFAVSILGARPTLLLSYERAVRSGSLAREERTARVQAQLEALKERRLSRSRAAKAGKGAEGPAISASGPGDIPSADRVTHNTVSSSAGLADMHFRVKHHGDGTLNVDIVGQSWPTVLQWYASQNDRQLCLSDLPAGYVGLLTHEPCSIREIGEALGALLFAKGFVIVAGDPTLVVCKTARIGAVPIPKSDVSAIDGLGDFEVASVMFDPGNMLADEMVDEITPLLPTFGKVAALPKLNRVEVLGNGRSLREIRGLLSDVRERRRGKQILNKCRLMHAPAAEVAGNISALVSENATEEPSRKTAGSGALIVPVAGDNSIVVCGTERTVQLVKAAVALLDVAACASVSLGNASERTVRYRLSTVSARWLIARVKAYGVLHPRTLVEPDGADDAIVVVGQPSDHAVIESLVKQLDGGERHAAVVYLNSVDSEQLAALIMRATNVGAQDDSSRVPKGARGASARRGFCVLPEPERRRLIVYGTAAELAEVELLVTKLGAQGKVQ